MIQTRGTAPALYDGVGVKKAPAKKKKRLSSRKITAQLDQLQSRVTKGR